MGSILSCKNIIKTYESDELFYALNDISINIKEGELLVIIGASGSGKSTLINILGGIDRCSSGNVYFKNQNITDFNEKELTKYRKNNMNIFKIRNNFPNGIEYTYIIEFLEK